MTDSNGLICPQVCKTKLVQVSKHGITIDMCTECKGVWLDRGELEKILDAVAVTAEQQIAARPAPAPQPQHQPQPMQSHHHNPFHMNQQGYIKYDDDYYKHKGYYKKSKLKTILDIFD